MPGTGNNMPEDPYHPLPRLGFICLLALCAGTILLAACQVTQATPTPILSTTHTPTATSTATRTPTITPSPAPTETATITPTPTPLVIAEPWERSREDKDKTLAQLMFPFIGGINHINRRGIDLSYGDLNLAFVGGSQIDPSQDVQALRETYAGQLNQDPQLLDQLASIRAQLEGNDNVNVVIEDGWITQVATKPYQTITRYVPESDGTLREMTAKEEPQLLPELVVDGPYIKRADTGEILQFKGVACTTFDWSNSPYYDTISLLSIAKSKGTNIARIGMDVNRMSNTTRLRDLEKTILWAEQNGMYVIVDPHVDRSTNIDNLPSLKTIDLMPVIAAELSDHNNVLIGVWNEPNEVSWSEWLPVLENMITKIRNNNKHVIIVVSGTEWSRNFEGMKNTQIDMINIIFDVHDYRWPGRNIHELYRWIIKKYPIIIGEFGSPDSDNANGCQFQSDCDIKYMKDVLTIVNEYPNLLHYTAFQIDYADDGLINRNGTPTNRGEIVFNDILALPPTDFKK